MKKRSILQKQRESVGTGGQILQVGVIGSAGEEEYLNGWKHTKGLLKAAKTIGRLLGKEGATIVTGGGGGIMSAVADAAIKEDGITIGIFNTLNGRAIGELYTVDITSGMFEGGPEYLLPLSSDVIIAMSGGCGTLNEISVAYRNEVSVVLLAGYGGWVDKLISNLVDGAYMDERKRTRFYIAHSPEEAVKIALKVGIKRLRGIVLKGQKFHCRENKKRKTGRRDIIKET